VWHEELVRAGAVVWGGVCVCVRVCSVRNVLLLFKLPLWGVVRKAGRKRHGVACSMYARGNTGRSGPRRQYARTARASVSWYHDTVPEE